GVASAQVEDLLVGQVRSGAGGVRGQLRGQGDAGEAGVQARGQEVRHRVTGGARRGRQDAVRGGPEVAVGGGLQQFTDVDHEVVGDRVRVDPAPGGLDLQTGGAVLEQQQGEHPRVVVGTDALAGFGAVVPRV